MVRTSAVIFSIACVSFSSCTKDSVDGLPIDKHLRSMPPVSDDHAAFGETPLARLLPPDVLAMIDDHMADFYPEIESIETTASYFPKLKHVRGSSLRGHVFSYRDRTNQAVFPPMDKNGSTSRRRMMSLYVVAGGAAPTVTQLHLKTNGKACADLAFFALSPDSQSKIKINHDDLNILHRKEKKMIYLSFAFSEVQRQLVQGTTIALYNPPKCQLTVTYAYEKIPPTAMNVDLSIQQAQRSNRQVQWELFTDRLIIEEE